MRASALHKVVIFAAEVFFERTPLPPSPTMNSPKQEAAPGDRIDLRISDQPEEPHTLKENHAKVFLFSSLIKQVLKSPNKQTMINDLIKKIYREMQNKSITILHHIENQNILLYQTVIWSHMKFLRIEDRVQ